MCCNEFVDRPVQTVATRFIKPLARLCGASPLLVPAVADAGDLQTLANILDGLLLTGSRSHVEPQRYGGLHAAKPTDRVRDEVALSLSGRMIERGKPVFGICRGLQEINVLFGGSLRDLEGEHHHAVRPEGAKYEILLHHLHDIAPSPDGIWADLGSAIRVNSAHRQGIDQVGSGLKVEAFSDDGVIEAISAPSAGAPVLAVQWHPEVFPDECAISRSFYNLLRDSLHEDRVCEV
jgi:putative glutamine amidotransferase